MNNLDKLNKIFQPLSFKERIRRLYDFFPEEQVLLTSSFGTNSAFLLHLISRVRPSQAVHFIDTTYHFPETIAYKKELENRWKLKIVDVRPDRHLNHFTKNEQSWKSDSDLCCSINKVMPLDEVKSEHKVWFSGLMSNQTRFRSGLEIFVQHGDIIKFHPLIDLTSEDVLRYKSFFRLPEHPLLSKGYGSVGCAHCTQKGEGRSGRWKGKGKTECGLHTMVKATVPVRV